MSLEDLRGRKVVLYFYPKDDTPGCTSEACDFRDNLARLAGAGAEVLGVSRDSLESHERFRRKYELPFELLSDDGSETAKAYGAYGTKNLYGREVEGTIRSTFLIDEEGNVSAVWSPVRVEGHVDQVLAALGVAGEAAAAADTSLAGSTPDDAPAARGARIEVLATSSEQRAPAKRTAARKPAPRASAAKAKKASRAGSASRAKVRTSAKRKRTTSTAGSKTAARAKKTRASGSKRAAPATRKPARKVPARTPKAASGARSSARKPGAAKSARMPVKSLRPKAKSQAKKPARSPAATSKTSQGTRARAKAGRSSRGGAPKRYARRS